MYLKSLVLKGFKSFADRSVLTLEPGFTAVVGPNGSGKSNISDAVLWVLGERNAKNLRGQAMEDVIFAGSSARKPVSLAEVELVLDNSDGKLPVDFNEVVLTRRMYRSGESEYLINNTPARRMDFLDILHDTGLGTGTHSIISQGNLDAILASKPSDRRALIEEAAGILKHKQRKERSARKLAVMDQHLTRVKDVTAEVERQLKPLARKAQRAQAYRGLADKLSELELILAVDNLRLLQGRWDGVLLQEKETAALIDVRNLASQEAEAYLEKLQKTLQEKGLYVGDLTAQRGRFHMVVERLDASDMILSEKSRTIRNRLSNAEDTMASAKRRISIFEDEIAELSEEYDEQRARRDAAGESMIELDDDLSLARGKREEMDANLAHIQSKLTTCERQLDETQDRLTRRKDSLSGLMTRKKILTTRHEELQQEIDDLQILFDDRCAGLTEDAAALEKLAQDSHDAARAVADAEKAVRLADVSLNHTRESRQKIAAEITALEHLNQSLRAQNDAASWVVEHAGTYSDRVKPLSSLITAPTELEFLVETLMGADLMAACLPDATYAQSLVADLVQVAPSGVTSVFYAGEDKGEETASVEILPRVNFGMRAQNLADQLTYPPHIANIVELVLGDVYLVANTDDAFALSQKTDAPYRFVTREGVIVCGPQIQYCMNETQGDGVLARERELLDLRSKLAIETANCDERERRCSDLKDDLERKRALSLELSQSHAQRKGEYSSAQAERERLASRLGAAQANFDAAVRDAADVDKELLDAQPEIDDMTQMIENLRASRAELDTSRNAMSAQRLTFLETEQRLAQQMADAKLAHATAVERVRSLDRQIRERREDLDRIARNKKRAEDESRSLRIAEKRIEPLHEMLVFLKEAAQRWVDSLASRAELEQSNSVELNEAINVARAKVREAQDELNTARQKLNDVRVEKGRLELQVESAIRSIVEDCQVPLDVALEIPAPEDRGAAEGEAFKLRKRIANMGTIDSSAAEEYEAMKERFDYLNSQIEDVEAARRALKRIVNAIDDRMKEQFDVTFEQVNANFQEIFSILFPGGSATLELVNAEDPDTLGVEVNAQPKGKKISKMMLMSGGEKSLTALALLFAAYRIRSTPFYILDEVEAALDDSNLRRLTGYLQTLHDDTQLIMITHQRRTMEMSDVLYGVSMQADGVTKVVSQKLEQALSK